MGEVPDLGRVAELEAVGEEHRAHRPVGHDRLASVEQRPEPGARRAAVEGEARRPVGERDRVDIGGRARGVVPVPVRAAGSRLLESSGPGASSNAVHRGP